MCSKPGCEKPVKARGWCNNHYSAATLQERKAAGYVPIDLRRSTANWNAEDFEQYWQFVKKELNLV